MPEPELLFAKYDGSAVLANQQDKLSRELDAYDADAVLTANVDAICDYFVDKYRINIPIMKTDPADIEASQDDEQFDARRDPNRFVFDSSRPVYIPGTRLTFHVPYSGDREAFYVRANSYTMNPPRAVITDDEVQFTYLTADPNDAPRLKTEFERELSRVREHLDWLVRDYSAFNDGLREQVRSRIEQRRVKLIADRGMVAGLGFKVRERPGAPKTYTVPTTRRVVAPRPPRGTGAPPEPALDSEIYEQILKVCTSMAVVLEQTPSTFATLGEEDIRNHFLVQLNGQFQGDATGETFSAAGKTDILVKVEGRNVFIGECKFWKGPKSAQDALDQLLSYATWRESKLALFVFARGGSFTDVLRKLDDAIAAHASVRRRVGAYGATGFRYTLARPDDPERELTLTVLAFAVPAVAAPTA